MNQHSEDILVQHAMVEYIKKQFGWESVYAYTQKHLGPFLQGM